MSTLSCSITLWLMACSSYCEGLSGVLCSHCGVSCCVWCFVGVMDGQQHPQLLWCEAVWSTGREGHHNPPPLQGNEAVEMGGHPPQITTADLSDIIHLSSETQRLRKWCCDCVTLSVFLTSIGHNSISMKTWKVPQPIRGKRFGRL